jgi:hypothetical protein
MSAGSRDGYDVMVVSEPGKGRRVYLGPARQRREQVEVKMAAKSASNLLRGILSSLGRANEE